MSCPVDYTKCPVNDEAQIRLNSDSNRVYRESKWEKLRFRNPTTCKYKVHYYHRPDMKTSKINIKESTLLKLKRRVTSKSPQAVLSSLANPSILNMK